MKIKTYTSLSKLKTFQERYEYLKLSGVVGDLTFGYDRYMNQLLYKSSRWIKTRDDVIIRDQGCNMGLIDYPIFDKIIVHHMNPIHMDDIEDMRDIIFEPEYLICVNMATHNAIHYGKKSFTMDFPPERTKGDTCPWKKIM
jgi:hypothetical protein